MTVPKPRLLFIGPRTFGYEREICREIELAGYQVDWFDERPSTSPLIKALIRVHPVLAGPLSNAYFDRIISHSRTVDYKVVFVIKGEALSAEKLCDLRGALPGARFIYYTWDSLKNVKGATDKLPYFDKVYSFDRMDCSSSGTIRHLPLFYASPYEKLPLAVGGLDTSTDIDLLVVASLHSDRYSVAQKIFREALRVLPNAKICEYFYFQSRWVFALRKLLDSQFMVIPWGAVKWKILTTGQTLSLAARSRIFVDIHHPGQTGLTMRMMESVGAKKKIITTNPDVKNYEFYDPDNILIVDRVAPMIPVDFLRRPYRPLCDEIYRRYSLRSWLKEILSSVDVPSSQELRTLTTDSKVWNADEKMF